MNNFFEEKQSHILLSLFVVGIFIRMYIMFVHYITPDETWHLADGLFFANGQIPIVDYSSRQPLYVFLIGLFVKLFGPSYLVGRSLLLLASIGTMVFLYLIAKLWFDKKVAFLALTSFLFLPFVYILEPLIQEQGLVIFFNCAAIYFASYSIFNKQNRSFLFISGILFGCAYYSRQTGLASIISLFLFLFFYEKFNIKIIIKNYYQIILGFFTLSAFFFIFYLLYMPFSEIINSNINPFYLIIKSIKYISSHTNDIAETNNFGLGFQDISQTKEYLSLAIQYNYVLIVSFFILLAVLLVQIFWKRLRDKNDINKISFLVIWLLVTALFYLYHYFYRGFFPQYIREFQLPLIIGFSYLVFYFVRKSINNDKIISWIIFILGLSIVLEVSYNYFIESYPSKIFSVLFIGIFFSIILLLKLYKSKKITQMLQIEKLISWGLLMLTIGVYIYTFSQCGRYLSIHFHGMWSPQMIDKVVNFINVNSGEDDGILAGIPIWAIESGRKIIPPYTHPLIFKEGISAEVNQQIYDLIIDNPPKIIISDRYTKEVYFEYFPWLKDFVDKYYTLEATFSELEFEIIKLYKLKKDYEKKLLDN